MEQECSKAELQISYEKNKKQTEVIEKQSYRRILLIRVSDFFQKQNREINQKKIERITLNIKIIDKVSNREIRRNTNFMDILEECKRKKWKWAGHIRKVKDDRQMKTLID